MISILLIFLALINLVEIQTNNVSVHHSIYFKVSVPSLWLSKFRPMPSKYYSHDESLSYFANGSQVPPSLSVQGKLPLFFNMH